jgi:hypothetical protein
VVGSVTWRVYEGGGAYLVGSPLDGPPCAVPSSIVVVVPLPQPSWLSVVVPLSPLSVTPPGRGVRTFGVVGLIFPLKNKANALVSIIEHEEKKKKTYCGPNDDSRRLGRVVREVARLWPRAVLCLLSWELVLTELGWWEEGGGRGGVVVVDGGGEGNSDELATTRLCALSYTAT